VIYLNCTMMHGLKNLKFPFYFLLFVRLSVGFYGVLGELILTVCFSGGQSKLEFN
jgi:hypothetical protein